MGLHHELPIYKNTRDLLGQTIKIMRNLPRDLKQTMGKTMMEDVSNLSRLIMQANVARGNGKSAPLTELVERVEVLRFQFRALSDLREIPLKHHADVIEMLDSIGKQANGWKRSSTASPAPDLLG